MSPKVKNVLKFLLFLGIGLGLIYLSVKDISLKDLQTLRDNPPNYWWLIASVLVCLLSHLIRAIRWRMLIEPVSEVPKLSNTFFAVMIGYMANYAPLPRLGEVYRCVILSRYEKAPVVALVGTVIVERVIDTFMLLLFFLVMLLVRFQKVYDVVMPKIGLYIHNKLSFVEKHYIVLILAIIIVVGGVAFILLKGENKLMGKVKKFVLNFWEGIKSVGKLKRPVVFWIYSVGIWVLYLLSTYMCMQCFSATAEPSLTIADAVVILIFGTLGVIVTPGGTGAYQVLIKNVLEKIYRIGGIVPFALGWIIWGSQFVLILILGLVSLILLPILNKNEQA
ncbi:MAG TPA: lysylphosphatidylglycerol synthase transmembrane domain-containing protein [Bacteroidia bacterium]|nr:lysylphosphatidylglycerol synthase transmembrane domain-containing protein [Bacteroidia bacterium]